MRRELPAKGWKEFHRLRNEKHFHMGAAYKHAWLYVARTENKDDTPGAHQRAVEAIINAMEANE